VFGGDKPPYSEHSEMRPVNYYGTCKALSDTFIQQNANEYLILRPITIYGPCIDGLRDNPVSFILKKLLNNEKLTLVNDNIVNMLYADDFVLSMRACLLKSITGVVNLSGDVSENRYELGKRICNLFGFDAELIKETDGKNFKLPATRAFETTFDNQKMKDVLGIQPSAVNHNIKRIYQDLLASSAKVKA
jgi:dTDP-4-dehydrorhamnose reductase